jgi:hypothetical protein
MPMLFKRHGVRSALCRVKLADGRDDRPGFDSHRLPLSVLRRFAVAPRWAPKIDACVHSWRDRSRRIWRDCEHSARERGLSSPRGVYLGCGKSPKLSGHLLIPPTLLQCSGSPAAHLGRTPRHLAIACELRPMNCAWALGLPGSEPH